MRLLAIPLLLLTALGAGSQTGFSQVPPTDLYLGQTPPGTTPEVFAPGILSLPHRNEGRIAFSPDGTECFFGITNTSFTAQSLYHTKLVDGTWTPQALVPFSVGNNNLEPFYSADGDTLYFTSDADSSGQRNLWMTDRVAEGWGTPERLPAPIDSAANEWFYSEAPGGTIYFVSSRPGGTGGTDIWRSRQQPGQPPQVENLGPVVNATQHDWDPQVSPNGQFLVFASGRPGGQGATDLYYSTHDGNGGWNAPRNMNTLGELYNTTGFEYAPSFSPDGQYLFFVRLGAQGDVYWVANPLPEPATGMFLMLALTAALLIRTTRRT